MHGLSEYVTFPPLSHLYTVRLGPGSAWAETVLLRTKRSEGIQGHRMRRNLTLLRSIAPFDRFTSVQLFGKLRPRSAFMPNPRWLLWPCIADARNAPVPVSGVMHARGQTNLWSPYAFENPFEPSPCL